MATKQNCLYLGNLKAKRDWGSARDYKAHHQPDDFVLATLETHSVRSFVEASGGPGDQRLVPLRSRPISLTPSAF
ncbi:GDP-mannose 4,6-dehydratase [Mesorhizobium opportunistum]|uniref:GDP-mannose 4,6-dehydratase n=1 Tax=Mesorhizobium opportunistum TaxID=593909 RepID=UPI003D9FF6C7